MPDLVAVRGAAPWFRRLYLPAYRVADAARYAGVSPQTAANWHYRNIAAHGAVLQGKEPRQHLSYLQLIELGIVAVFRSWDVPLESIRRTREYMGQTFNSEFPFAEYRFKTDGFHLLMNLVDVVPELKNDDLIVADKGGQLGWASMMEDKLLQFDYDMQFELALRWFVAGRDSTVVIDPRVAFGAPTVNGIATWVLKGRYKAGETLADIKEDFGLPEQQINDALKFEGIEALAA
jgi:uncharacterized protein (DUF433 family)